jgi:hypothetical protein
VINNQTCTYSQHRYACQANRRYHLEWLEMELARKCHL